MFCLAIIPSIALLFYIYKKDKRDKEPFRLLLKCFVWGIIAIIPIVIMETVFDEVLECFATEGSVAYAIVDGFFVAALSEELFKYLALKKTTWKAKEFNCFFDGLVYSVFVSLGFATFENVMYVMDGGVSSAVLRMFTAVPGHACDAVFMGYYYSRAKKARIDGNRSLEKKNKRLALWIPIFFHGMYDCLISFEEEVAGEDVVIMGILMWIVFVIIQFVMSFKLVKNVLKRMNHLLTNLQYSRMFRK